METRKTFEAVRLHDPAIDWDAMKNPPTGEDGIPEYEPYDEGRFALERDLARLRLYPGEQLMRFTFRRLTRPQSQKFVSTAISDDDRAIKAFQAGVVAIHFPDGAIYKPAWLGRAALAMDEKELVALEAAHELEMSDLVDIGSQILARSEVPLDCTPAYPVPRSSVAAWLAVSRRSAERNRSGARPTSGGPSDRTP